MADLKILCFDENCMNIPEASTPYTAGANIDITNNEVSVKNSPAFTGTPTAPTNGTASTSNTQIATTAFVQNAINRRLPKSVVSATMSSYSLANNSETSKDVWTAPAAGTLIGTAEISFAANATGAREAGLKKAGAGIGAGLKVSASASGITKLNVACATRVASGNKISIYAFQNSGGAINVSGYFFGYFIPD